MSVDIEDACELMKALDALKQDVDGLFAVWRALADEAGEHFEGARPSTRDGETIWY